MDKSKILDYKSKLKEVAYLPIDDDNLRQVWAVNEGWDK